MDITGIDIAAVAGLVGTTGTAIVSIVKAVQASRKAGDASQQVYSDWAPQSNMQIYNES